MRTKQQIHELLINDPFYSSVIKDLDDAERSRIKDIVEPMFVDMMSIVEELSEDVSKNPEAMNEFMMGLKEREHVINEMTEMSGSRK